MNEPCDCCTGTESLTPQPIANRPALGSLAYRVGTHAVFLETMQARLAAAARPELAGLRTREPDDASIALLDAWATVADVLTFYQERLANEGYLRTATERRSVLELARLIGYTPRPGVAATVYLAYTMEKDAVGEIPAGSRAQSIPGPGELPQTFETSETIAARAEWNNLQPRMHRPQLITRQNVLTIDHLYLAGTATGLKPNDPLLFVLGNRRVVRRAKSVEAQFANDRTLVVLQPLPELAVRADGDAVPNRISVASTRGNDAKRTPLELLQGIIAPLAKAPSLQPANSQRLQRAITGALGPRSDLAPQLLASLQPRIADAMYAAWSNTVVEPPVALELYALRVKAAPFGYNAPLKPILDEEGVARDYEEWPLSGSITLNVDLINANESSRFLIAVTRAGDTHSITVSPTETEQRFELGEDTVLVRMADSGGAAFVVDFVQQERHITIEELTDRTQQVTINDDGSRALAFGQSLSYGVGARSVKMSLIRGRLSIVDSLPVPLEPRNEISLDAPYDQIVPESWVAIYRSFDATPIVAKVQNAATIARADFGITGKVTHIRLDSDWLNDNDRILSDLRRTTVFAQSELLTLADEPILEDICGNRVELDRLYNGLQSGRWVIVSGERTDIMDADDQSVPGVHASELVMLTGISQDVQTIEVEDEQDRLTTANNDALRVEEDTTPPTRSTSLPGDKIHSTLVLANSLAYCYKRDTVTIAGNVVKATHGETRAEVLGAGDASKAFQAFALRQPPLTYVSAPTVSGVASTLEVRVNDLEWHEAETLVGLGPADRAFVTRTADDSTTTVIFGDGVRGARLPTGVENVRAKYRNGIGKAGNVKAEQVSLLGSRPLGAKAVINPLRASGGADKETRDQAREIAPLSTLALDRLVSVQDYADFARMFAGIGKATAARLSDGKRQLIHVTIAGAEDIPIDQNSDLYQNLRRSLRHYGDPYVPIQVAVRELLALVISAGVRIHPDYLWEAVERAIRAALLDTFSFARLQLAEPVYLAQVISTIQHVPGVVYVDVDAFASISEQVKPAELEALRAAQAPQSVVRALAAHQNRAFNEQDDTPDRRILPAQLAYLTPAVPDTLILKELPA